MNQINLKSYAKINLSLDVIGTAANGYHQVEMVMQQILLCDDVSVKWTENKTDNGLHIDLSTNRHFLPTDKRNLAYAAAEALCQHIDYSPKGTLKIDIKKRIPVAAGLAGGSSNCATVLHALNLLWNLNMPFDEISDVGKTLGSDIPFCLAGQVATSGQLKKLYGDNSMAAHCVLATGTGTDLKPIKGLRSHLVLSKPAVNISTAEVYRGIDCIDIPRHPNTQELIYALEKNNISLVKKNMINVLENYTLKSYPIVVYTKNKMQSLCDSQGVLMSGSGPAIFGLCSTREDARHVCEAMLSQNRECFWTRTTW